MEGRKTDDHRRHRADGEITRSLPRYKGIKGNSSGRTEGRGNRDVNDGEAREGVRGEKVGGRNGRSGSREGSLNVLVEWPFAKIYTRRHTENRFLSLLPWLMWGFGFAAVAYVG